MKDKYGDQEACNKAREDSMKEALDFRRYGNNAKCTL
jgi:hypothetical protein